MTIHVTVREASETALNGLTFGYLRFTEIQSNRILVTVECLYGFKPAIASGIQRIVQP